MERLRIAVIGSGISGLSAAWLLSQKHHVTLIEAANTPGGHSNTVDVDVDGRDVAVDTGFIVYNPPAYPNLTALFRHLDVPTAASDMSFAVSLDGGHYEYAGADLIQLVGQARNLLSLDHWRLIRDIPRFFQTAMARMPELGEDVTLGQYLQEEGYSDAFRDRHLLPMAGAIWSAAPGDMLDYPARSFLKFFSNHGLLKMTNRPLWRTVKGGSREYVSRILRDGRFDTRLNTPIRSVRRQAGGVNVECVRGEAQIFDQVVIAAHADQALAMLADPLPEESRLLSAFRYSRNRAILHRDARLMPRRRRLWSSWNYLAGTSSGATATSAVTYWMNKLQPLSTTRDLFVSLNPLEEPAIDKVLAEFDYSHPIFDPPAMRAQRELWSIQGQNRVWFCGAHLGSGFHEDGIQSGLAVAEQLGKVRRPWNVADESGRIFITEANPGPVPFREAAE